MIKTLMFCAALLSFNVFSAETAQDSTKKHLLVFIGGFGQTRHGVKKMMKELETRYPKLNGYEVMCFSHTNSKRKIKRGIEKYNPTEMTLACFSMGGNTGLELASELNCNFNLAFVDPWFLASKWQNKDSLVNDEFRQRIQKLPDNSMMVYGSDFVMKNNKDLSKVSGLFGSKNGKDCYKHIRAVWGDEGKVFRSGAGHMYFPELYVKQFLPELKLEESSVNDVGI